MLTIRYIREEDKTFWFTLDRNLNINEFLLKCRDKWGYVINDND